MSKRVFDDSFKKMAIDLSHSRGSVKEVADELGINDSLLSKWRQRGLDSKQSPISLTEDQKLWNCNSILEFFCCQIIFLRSLTLDFN